MANKQTKEIYKKLAANFYTTKIMGEPTAFKIQHALSTYAKYYRPRYWWRLKHAIQYDLNLKGHNSIAISAGKTQNPLTTNVVTKHNCTPPSKQKRVNKVHHDELRLIAKNLSVKPDPLLESALILTATLGCRPVEINTIEVLNNGLVFISSSKKREANDRGVDRYLKLPISNLTKVKRALSVFKVEVAKLKLRKIKSTPQHILERRLATLTKGIWPQRRHRITLYTFRHQLSSDLKASGLTREEVAYIMGHRATISADSYGDSRCGRTRTIEAGIPLSRIKKETVN